MTEPSLPDLDALSLSLGRRLNQACDRFEEACRSGVQPRIEDFLTEPDAAGRAALLRELILLDAYYRRARGEGPAPEDYRARFPDLDPAWLNAAVAAKGDDASGEPRPSTLTGEKPASGLPLRCVDRYQLLELLGRGAMGEVYKARHVHTGEVVALKLVQAEKLTKPGTAERFLREIKAQARLRHRHVVRAWDGGPADGQLFLVMEYAVGLSLDRAVRSHGRLPVADACEAARQAALGLQHAFENGLVHRDVKPSNLILTADSQGPGPPEAVVKVLDLGLAKFLYGDPDLHEELTAAGYMLGTADYMAPEQWADPRSADIRADLYSLGCTLYHLLAGRPPFGDAAHDTWRKKMAAHEQAPVPPIRELRPEVPAGLAAVLGRLLAKRPEDRFGTPREAAQALEPFCGYSNLARLLGESPAAGALTTAWPGPVPPRPRRRFLPLGPLSLGAAVAGLVCLPALVFFRRVSCSVRVMVVVGLVCLTTLVLFLVGLIGPGATGPDAGTSPPLQDDRLVLRIWSKDGRHKGSRLGDPGTLPARPGDQLRTEVRLNQPAYIYLLALDSQGEVTPLYPWHRDVTKLGKTIDDPPPVVLPQRELIWPSLESGMGLPLDDHSGLETILLLARRAPLPGNVRLASLMGPLPLPPAPLRDLEEFVLRGSGESESAEALRVDRHRGFKTELAKIDEPVEQLLGRLRPEFELLRAVRFAHQGR
jgi:hypothetical protein